MTNPQTEQEYLETLDVTALDVLHDEFGNRLAAAQTAHTEQLARLQQGGVTLDDLTALAQTDRTLKQLDGDVTLIQDALAPKLRAQVDALKPDYLSDSQLEEAAALAGRVAAEETARYELLADRIKRGNWPSTHDDVLAFNQAQANATAYQARADALKTVRLARAERHVGRFLEDGDDHG